VSVETMRKKLHVATVLARVEFGKILHPFDNRAHRI
jgi:hypothetical protein